MRMNLNRLIPRTKSNADNSEHQGAFSQEVLQTATGIVTDMEEHNYVAQTLYLSESALKDLIVFLEAYGISAEYEPQGGTGSPVLLKCRR